MSTVILDGKTLKNMLIGGAEYIKSNSEHINELNVFPVPDGDTGTNMTKTLEGGVSHVISEDAVSISSVMDKFSEGLLLGARGNSGVILSQIFAGIKDVLSKCDTVNAIELSEAYRTGIMKSYASVSNPTEGTILTVFRESTEYAAKHITEESTIEDFFKLHIEEAQRSLERTKEILPVLAEADVVDSGGAGYLCIAVGMYSALTGEYKADVYQFSETTSAPALDLNKFRRDSVMTFGYCTEYLLRLMDAKCDVEAFDANTLVSELEKIGGNSIVAYKEGDIVKVHVHLMTPASALALAQKYGEFLTVKIENMELGHNEAEKPQKKEKAEKKKRLATLAVASGEGMCALFTDMGADGIVSGGQTNNPSAEEFINAFDDVNAENIIVLPNNKNVMLAAKQAADMYKDASVYIVPTYTLMEGYGALSVINPAIDSIQSIVESAERAAKGIVGGEITRAVRDVTIGGKSIKCGDYIAIVGGEITAVEETRDEALLSMLEAVEDIEDYEIINIFVGNAVSDEQRAEITETVEEKYPDHEIMIYLSGQELYDYFIAIE